MTETFTEVLRRENAAIWEEAVGHRFVRELWDGSIADDVMAGYLVQDHRFLDRFLLMIGAAMASADTFAARITLGKFAGDVAGDENTYFIRCFDALGVSEDMRRDIPDTAATAGFKAIFKESADTGNYAAILAVLSVCEWLYLDWATRAPAKRPERFIHDEWITLHDYPEFHEFVGFLRAELDRVGPDHATIARDFFARTVALELDFFNQSYESPINRDA